MQLKRMNKLTVLAEMDSKERLVSKLAECGVPHFHLLECKATSEVKEPESAGEARKVLLEVIVDSSKVEGILQGLKGSDTQTWPSRIAVSDVFASPSYDGEKEKKKSSSLEALWVQELITA